MMKSSSIKPYEIVYLDPPWDYQMLQHAGAGKGDTGGASTHYETLKIAQLKEFPIRDLLADNSLVFMWVTNPHLANGIDLLRAWNLKYVTVGFVWNKGQVNPGYYTMSQCELCLVAKRGKIPQPRGSRREKQYLESLRQEHSKKPDEVRDRICRMFPTQRKVELFARQRVPGWDAWGNEIVSTPVLEKFLSDRGW